MINKIMTYFNEKIKNLKKWLNLIYMQFILNTTQYVMEPFERKIFIIALLLILNILFYSTFIYLIMPTYSLFEKLVHFSNHSTTELFLNMVDKSLNSIYFLSLTHK